MYVLETYRKIEPLLSPQMTRWDKGEEVQNIVLSLQLRLR